MEPTARGTRVVVTLAALVIVLAGLKAAEELMVPLAFAALIAILTAPAVTWLQHKRVPAFIAVSLVVGAVVVVLVAFGTLLGGSINDFAAAVPRYQNRLNVMFGDYAARLEDAGIAVSIASLTSLVNPGAIMGVASQLVSQLASVLSDTALIVLTVVFVLMEVASLPRKLRRAIGDPDADLTRYSAWTHKVQRYVAIKTVTSAATGLGVGVALTLLGVDFPLLWGLLAFFLNYIPNIGSIIAAIPPMLLALVQFGVGSLIGVGAVFVAINTVIGNVIEPRWMGRRFGLSSLVVFLSLVFWGWLWGPMGMLLSVPLTMIVKILLESSDQFEPVAKLMDEPLSQRPRA
jgi:predicted PurR-regulated permease PerM